MAPPGISSLTDPTVQISRSGFLKQDSPVYVQTWQIRGGSNG